MDVLLSGMFCIIILQLSAIAHVLRSFYGDVLNKDSLKVRGLCQLPVDFSSYADFSERRYVYVTHIPTRKMFLLDTETGNLTYIAHKQ